MIDIPEVVELPLHKDEDGAIRVGDTRVLLEVVISTYQQGKTPEAIVESFPTLKLADVYAVIAYYLSYRDEVDKYVQTVEHAGEELRKKFEELQSYKPLTRDMLLARLEEKKQKPE